MPNAKIIRKPNNITNENVLDLRLEGLNISQLEPY